MVKMSYIHIHSVYVGKSEEKHMGKTYVTDEWEVDLTFEDRSMTIPYFLGAGYNGAEPTIKPLIDALISDYFLYINSRDMYDFAREVNIEDEDEIRIKEEWNKLKEQSEKLEYLVGVSGIIALNAELQMEWSYE